MTWNQSKMTPRTRCAVLGFALFVVAAMIAASALSAEEKGMPAPAIPDWAKVSKEQIDYAQKAGLPVAKELDLGAGVKMRFVLIAPGEFKMGSPANEENREEDEGPVHRVKITKPFYVGACEVTNREYRCFKPDHDSKAFEGLTLNADDQPAVCVSWDDATAFCKWLSEKTKLDCRLPTEAEWEYACRAGTQTIYWWGTSETDAGKSANVADRAARRKWAALGAFDTVDGYAVAAPVGSLKPNAFGLYDMVGNVWEWCNDWYDGRYYRESPLEDPKGPAKGKVRVVRGGAWSSTPMGCRSAYRYNGPPANPLDLIGFRVVARDLRE